MLPQAEQNFFLPIADNQITVIEDTERLTGCAIERAHVDKGYQGHDTENPHGVFISGQKRGVFGLIKRELRRRSATEAVIGHMKAEGHLGRCYLKGHQGDAANVILTAVGYNLRRVLAWLRIPLRLFLIGSRRQSKPLANGRLIQGVALSASARGAAFRGSGRSLRYCYGAGVGTTTGGVTTVEDAPQDGSG